MELFCANSQEVLLELEAAIEEHSLYDVLRCFCEATNHGMDLTDPLPSSVSLYLHTAAKPSFSSNFFSKRNLLAKRVLFIACLVDPKRNIVVETKRNIAEIIQ